MSTLTRDQISQFKTEGYCLYHDQLFDREALHQISAVFEEHLDARGAKRADELDTPHFTDRRLLEFLLAPEVLDKAEQLIGPDIGLWSSHFICKEPFTGRRTPWHEDSAYWKGKFDRLDQIVTFWLALDDSTLENGCMGVIPGTHRHGFSAYTPVEADTNTFGEEISEGSVDESKAVWFELQRGQCSIHDGRIIHGAGPNTSPSRRAGYTMRYFNLGMKFNKEHPGNEDHRLWYGRGRNLANNPLIYF